MGAATVTSGLLGWVTLVVAGRTLGAVEFAEFAVLWGAFFGIGGMASGLQQEVSRSVSVARVSGDVGAPVLVGVLAVVVPILAVLAGASFVSLSGSPSRVVGSTAVAMVMGLVAISVMTMVNGVLTARGEWAVLWTSVIGDPFLRLLTLVAVIVASLEVDLAWVIVAGAGIWVILLPLREVRRALTARGADSLRRFLVRVLLAMSGAGFAALLVAGYPWLFALTTTESLDPVVGPSFAALMITRGVILMPVFGMRPLIISHLLNGSLSHRLFLRRLALSGAGIALLVSLAAFAFGPGAMRMFFGSEFSVPAGMMVVIAVGSVALALMTISGLVLVVTDHHADAAAGWLLALMVTVACLLLPLETENRLLFSLLVGPATGLAVHGFALRRTVFGALSSQSSPSEKAVSRSCLE